MFFSMRFSAALSAAVLAGLMLLLASSSARAHDAEACASCTDACCGSDGDGGRLHFSHPLIAESPSPDTKVRFDYFFMHRAGVEAADVHTFNLEAEYAFQPWLSLEIDAPYTRLDPRDGKATDHFDVAEVALKYANFTFADRGLLLGGGIELGLPSGDEERGIGSDHVVEIAPYVDAGYRRGRFELVSFLKFAIPTNQQGPEHDEVDLEVEYNAALLYHATERLELILELDGSTVAAGEENESILNLTPGVKFCPLADRRLQVGLGASLPLTRQHEFEVRTILSVFWHF